MRLCESESEVRRAEQAIADTFAVKSDVATFVETVSTLQTQVPQWSPQLQWLIGGLIKSPLASQIVARVLDSESLSSALVTQLQSITEGFADRPLGELRQELENAQKHLDELPDFLHCMSQLGNLPTELSTMFARFPLNPLQLEAAAADKSIEIALRTDLLAEQIFPAVEVCRHFDEPE